eukprot:TRINITY_DN8577_c1_g1_i1.p1 TRINITY_DN8577_c1_g1~~TRINITY_DN8577_c1_g1_i1.p1  ORF type:complete len:237 (+),score=56.41 TRINITY_DN8577_c1_g1_i1:147-857(+)
MPSWLQATSYITSNHHGIVKLAASLTIQDHPRETAVCIHDYVRDTIPFGWSSSFDQDSAKDVLRRKIGFCNTKATLFISLLRAAGIPARQHFVTINNSVLYGILSGAGNGFVDHSYTEVFLNDEWLKVDSYVVDTPLATVAKRKLVEDGRGFGNGMHIDGTTQWDGRSDAFSQFVINDKHDTIVSTRDYGVFEDVGDFYQRATGLTQLSWPMRTLVTPLLWAGSRAAARLRNQVDA